MYIHILQHVAFETPGTITDWAQQNGYSLSFTRLYEKDPVYPAIGHIDMLVILGGPMAVYEADRFPWMAQEKAFIAAAVKSEKIVLGICLGAQLLAGSLGARVYPGPSNEIGFFPIATKGHDLLGHVPQPWTVFHWHGDSFDIPPGAELLASSDAYANQGFVKGRCVGLQFHPEADADLIAAMVRHEGEALVPDAFVQSADAILAAAEMYLADKVNFMTLLDKIIRLPLPHET